MLRSKSSPLGMFRKPPRWVFILHVEQYLMFSDRTFWLLHIRSSHSWFLSRLILVMFESLHLSLYALLYRVVSVFCYIYLLYIVSGEWKSFRSKIILRNLYWLTTGISKSSNFIVGSLCIFLNWQKCMHWVFVLEILNPFMVAHLFILLILCCSWHSAVRIFGFRCDAEIIYI